MKGLFSATESALRWTQRIVQGPEISEHAACLYISMEQPLIVKQSAEPDTKPVSFATSNLRYCAFVAAELQKDGDVFRGFMHFNGENTRHMHELVGFFSELAGDDKGRVSVRIAQNMDGSMESARLLGLHGMKEAVLHQSLGILNAYGFKDIHNEVLGSSRIMHVPGVGFRVADAKTSYIIDNNNDFWKEFSTESDIKAKERLVERHTLLLFDEEKAGGLFTDMIASRPVSRIIS